MDKVLENVVEFTENMNYLCGNVSMHMEAELHDIQLIIDDLTTSYKILEEGNCQKDSRIYTNLGRLSYLVAEYRNSVLQCLDNAKKLAEQALVAYRESVEDSGINPEEYGIEFED